MADPRNFHIPKAASYSAQRIADISSPDGEAAVNEEFRRIQSAINAVAAKVPVAATATAGAASAASAATPAAEPAAEKKLSIEHNGVTVLPFVTEIINFEDTDSIQFGVQYISPKKAEIKAKNRGTNNNGYRARKVGEILYSVDGIVFTPEWPLTSQTQGILLTDDGIIMIRG
jgi:hypothetical protein